MRGGGFAVEESAVEHDQVAARDREAAVGADDAEALRVAQRCVGVAGRQRADHRPRRRALDHRRRGKRKVGRGDVDDVGGIEGGDGVRELEFLDAGHRVGPIRRSVARVGDGEGRRLGCPRDVIVDPGAAEDRRVSGPVAAIDLIVVGAAGERIVADAAMELVVAAAAAQLVGGVVAGDLVAAAPADHVLDADQHIGADVVARRDADGQVLVAAGQLQQLADRVRRATIAIGTGEWRIRPVQGGEVDDDRILRGGKLRRVVVAGAAIVDVVAVARAADDGVVAVAGIDDVVAVAGIDRVAALAGRHGVVAGPRLDVVAARSGRHRDRRAAGEGHVETGLGRGLVDRDRFVRIGEDERVPRLRREIDRLVQRQRTRADEQVADTAILDDLDADEIVERAVRRLDHPARHVRRRPVGIVAGGYRERRRGVVDGIDATAAEDDVGVGTRAGGDVIVAVAAIDPVRTAAVLDVVVTVAAVEELGAGAALEPVVAVLAMELAAAIARDQGVVAGAALEPLGDVRPVMAAHVVAGIGADDMDHAAGRGDERVGGAIGVERAQCADGDGPEPAEVGDLHLGSREVDDDAVLVGPCSLAPQVAAVVRVIVALESLLVAVLDDDLAAVLVVGHEAQVECVGAVAADELDRGDAGDHERVGAVVADEGDVALVSGEERVAVRGAVDVVNAGDRVGAVVVVEDPAGGDRRLTHGLLRRREIDDDAALGVLLVVAQAVVSVPADDRVVAAAAVEIAASGAAVEDVVAVAAAKIGTAFAGDELVVAAIAAELAVARAADDDVVVLGAGDALDVHQRVAAAEAVDRLARADVLRRVHPVDDLSDQRRSREIDDDAVLDDVVAEVVAPVGLALVEDDVLVADDEAADDDVVAHAADEGVPHVVGRSAADQDVVAAVAVDEVLSVVAEDDVALVGADDVLDPAKRVRVAIGVGRLAAGDAEVPAAQRTGDAEAAENGVERLVSERVGAEIDDHADIVVLARRELLAAIDHLVGSAAADDAVVAGEAAEGFVTVAAGEGVLEARAVDLVDARDGIRVAPGIDDLAGLGIDIYAQKVVVAVVPLVVVIFQRVPTITADDEVGAATGIEPGTAGAAIELVVAVAADQLLEAVAAVDDVVAAAPLETLLDVRVVAAADVVAGIGGLDAEPAAERVDDRVGVAERVDGRVRSDVPRREVRDDDAGQALVRKVDDDAVARLRIPGLVLAGLAIVADQLFGRGLREVERVVAGAPRHVGSVVAIQVDVEHVVAGPAVEFAIRGEVEHVVEAAGAQHLDVAHRVDVAEFVADLAGIQAFVFLLAEVDDDPHRPAAGAVFQDVVVAVVRIAAVDGVVAGA